MLRSSWELRSLQSEGRGVPAVGEAEQERDFDPSDDVPSVPESSDPWIALQAPLGTLRGRGSDRSASVTDQRHSASVSDRQSSKGTMCIMQSLGEGRG